MRARLRFLPPVGLLLLAPALLTSLACQSSEDRRPAQAASAQAAEEDPAQLFTRLGCQGCHRPGGLYHSLLVQAREKPPEQVAQFILNPRKFRPGAMMPAFEKLLTEEQALSLARWIHAGNP